MYLSYINIGQELKHTIPAKNLKQNMKQMYEKTLAKIKLPYSFKSNDVQFTVDKVIVCSDNIFHFRKIMYDFLSKSNFILMLSYKI